MKIFNSFTKKSIVRIMKHTQKLIKLNPMFFFSFSGLVLIGGFFFFFLNLWDWDGIGPEFWCKNQFFSLLFLCINIWLVNVAAMQTKVAIQTCLEGNESTLFKIWQRWSYGPMTSSEVYFLGTNQPNFYLGKKKECTIWCYFLTR